MVDSHLRCHFFSFLFFSVVPRLTKKKHKNCASFFFSFSGHVRWVKENGDDDTVREILYMRENHTP